MRYAPARPVLTSAASLAALAALTLTAPAASAAPAHTAAPVHHVVVTDAPAVGAGEGPPTCCID